MKKIYLIIALFVLTLNINAQNEPILRTVTIQDYLSDSYEEQNGDYIKDTNNILDYYTGTWKYENGNDTFILKIQKVNQFYNKYPNGEYYYDDILIIAYKLVKNGQTLVDNLNAPLINTFHNLGNSSSNKYGSFSFTNTTNHLSGVMTDIPLNITVSSEIHPFDVNLNTGEITKIKLHLNGLNSIRGNPESFYDSQPTFIIPNNVELIKQ